MASRTDIANLALTRLGAAHIVALDDDSVAAGVINTLFAPAVEAELRANLWHFSRTRARLAQMVDAPTFGFAAQYMLPADCLRLLRVSGIPGNPAQQPPWQIEAGRILINHSGPLDILYIARVDDSGRFDALFVQVLAARLALEACERITNSNTKKQMLAEDYAQALKTARRANAIERPAVRPADGTWLAARR